MLYPCGALLETLPTHFGGIAVALRAIGSRIGRVVRSGRRMKSNARAQDLVCLVLK